MNKIWTFFLLFFTTQFSRSATLDLKLFFEGYYAGAQLMCCAHLCVGLCRPGGDNITDTIMVEFHDTTVTSSIFFSAKCLLYTNGFSTLTFPDTLIGERTYIGVKHRNALETWSLPVTLTTSTFYDFTTANSQSCGNNMVEIDFSPPTWAFHQCDVNQDGRIDQTDSIFIVNSIGQTGYSAADLNCDCVVDSLDLQSINIHYYLPTSCTHFLTTSLENKAWHIINLSLSPNPTTTNLLINFSSPLKTAALLLLTNTLGQTVASYSLNRGEIKKEEDISGVARGVYFLVLQTEEGRVVRKVMKQ